ncbi:MAG: A/G-specific adenine glycosylase [Pirellulaceae bacterium]|nr:A/G-specific adenine glycosylase [Pirellulaceae bacterium]
MKLRPLTIDSQWLSRFRTRLTTWYEKNQRSLPWRDTHDPYFIWISEIMLQQTQVATVLPYYRRFIEQFASIEALAQAEETEVLKLWEGLGYYRRARQLHAAARQMVEQFSGRFPTDFDKVLSLPGIGRYTAGAICSFAYDQATPIVEANTQRLYARLLKLTEPLSDRESQTAMWDFAQKILPSTNARRINQAVMELGSLVCQPKPQCDLCPLQVLCPTFANGLQSKIPIAKKKTPYEVRHEAALIVANSKNQFLIRQCGPDEWWSGLWDFPRFEIAPTSDDGLRAQEINSKARQLFGIICSAKSPLFTVKHSVTKYRITLTCYEAKRASRMTNAIKQLNADTSQTNRWVSLAELDAIPLSASGRRVVKALQKPGHP